MTRAKILTTLTWLIEAGADGAIAEEPVNRFRAANPPRSEPQAPGKPPEQLPATIQSGPPAPQAKPPAAVAARQTAEAVSLSTPAGAARALASGCATLEELRQALINFDGCGDLKRSAKNTVFADGTPDRGIMLIEIGRASCRERV